MAELCWRGLRNFPAIWAIVRRWLALLALVMLVYAAIASAKNSSPMIAFLLTAERSLDLGMSVILVALLGVGVRYQVWLGGIERKVVLGFSVYSTFQVVNNSFMRQWMMKYFNWWVSASVVSFEVAMLIWIAPLLRPLPPKAPSPALLSEEASVTLLRQIVEQMRRIVEELKRLGKSRWK